MSNKLKAALVGGIIALIVGFAASNGLITQETADEIKAKSDEILSEDGAAAPEAAPDTTQAPAEQTAPAGTGAPAEEAAAPEESAIDVEPAEPTSAEPAPAEQPVQSQTQ